MKEFEQIYSENSDLVYNLALQYVQNKEEAEEITQDVFLSIYQNLTSFRKDAKPSTWIYRITINKSLDYIKFKNRKKRFGYILSLFSIGASEAIPEIPTFEHPGILLEQKEIMEDIFRKINNLPKQQKTALILSKIESKSQKEIAEIMDLTPKAVESLIQRAKNSLFNKLTQNEGNEIDYRLILCT